jgi:hypothetical protein
MRLEDLSMDEKLSLCRCSARTVAGRYRSLARGAGSRDEPLRRLFEGLADDVEKRLPTFESSTTLPGEEEERIVRGFFPSLSKSAGAPGVDRETGTYLAECLVEEFAAFYRTLAQQATDEESREFFMDAKKAEEFHLEFVRHVLL